MRDNLTRAFGIVAVALIFALIGCGAAVYGAPSAVWPSYHYDMTRQGMNDDALYEKQSTTNLIFVFPRPTSGYVAEEMQIVDNTSTFFNKMPQWSIGTIALDSWDATYLYKKALYNDPEKPPTGIMASWKFPGQAGGLVAGNYLIYVWVPSDYGDNPSFSNTTTAQYKVYDDTGVTEVEFNQRDGGYWRLLTERQFSFTGTGSYRVDLTNVTGDTQQEIDESNLIVVADAIKFVPATGMEIYSSPTSGNIDITYPNTANYTVPHTTTAVVYTGTVEPPVLSGTEATNRGAVYCVNSITASDTEVTATSPLWDVSQYLGTPVWRYPNDNLAARTDIEGPIENGVMSSVTLAEVNGDMVAFFAGMDRQVYAVNATTGALIWKGPGVTVGEDNTIGIEILSKDAFGGKYHSIPCSTLTTVLYDFAAATSVKKDGPWAYSVYVWLPARSSGELNRPSDVKYKIHYKSSTGSASDTVTVDQSVPANQGTWVKLGTSYFDVTSVELSSDTSLDKTTHAVAADAIMIVPRGIEEFGKATPVVDSATGSVFASNAAGRVVSFDLNNNGAVKWVYPALRTKSVISSPDDMDQDPLGSIASSPAYHSSSKSLVIATVDGEIQCIDDTGKFVWSSTQDFNKEDLMGFTSSPAIDVSGAISSVSNKPYFYIGSIDGHFYCYDLGGSGNNVQPEWQYPDSSNDSLGSFQYSTPAIAKVGTIRRAWIGSQDSHIYSFDLDAKDRLYVDYDNAGAPTTHGAVQYYEPSATSAIQGSIALDTSSNGSRSPTMFVGDMGDNGLLHWYEAEHGTTSTWQYSAWATMGNLFSSPNITKTKINGDGASVHYVYIGCSDGRIYAFSNEDGAWGGKWAGGLWPFAGRKNENNTSSKTAPDTGIQFDIFEGEFADRSLKFDPEQKVGNLYVIPSDYLPSWPADTAATAVILDEKMKMPTTSLAGKSKPDIDAQLKTDAEERRKYCFGLTARTASSSDPKKADVYVEWGENLNVILWNLPGEKYLYGTNTSLKRSNIKFRMVNNSTGASAGGSFSGKVTALKPYTVLDSATKETDNTSGTARQVAAALKYSEDEEVKRCYVVGTVTIDTSSTNARTPGPGWVLYADVKIKDTDADDAPAPLYTIPLARLTSPHTPVTLKNAINNKEIYQEQYLGINNPLAIMVNEGNNRRSIAWDSLPKPDRTDPQAHFNGNSATGSSSLLMPDLNAGPVMHGTSSPQMRLYVADRSATGTKLKTSSTPGMPQGEQINRFRVSSGDLGWMSRTASTAVPTPLLKADGTAVASSRKYGYRFPWEQGLGSADYPNIMRTSQNYRNAYDDSDPANYPTKLPSLLFKNSTNVYYPPDPSGWSASTDPSVQSNIVYTTIDVPRYQPANERGYRRRMQAYIDSNNNGRCDSGVSVLSRPGNRNIEAYREFRVTTKVPPDPKLLVEEQTIDLGRAPHGLGAKMDEFCAYNPDSNVQKWFKKITVKNAGNVNLYRLRVDHNVPLVSDQSNPTAPIPGNMLTSSLDSNSNFSVFSAPPFTTMNGTDDLGYTLSKPRVGEPDPTILTIPDKRKWDLNFDDVQGGAARRMAGWDTTSPLSPEVSIIVPLSQPVGTYSSWFSSWDPSIRSPYVRIFSDLFSAAGSANGVWDAYEPIADPGFQLKLTVQENQLTGGVTPYSLPHIDVPGDTPSVGDTTPAAFKDPVTGKVTLVWSSNRTYLGSTSVSTEDMERAMASAPWLLNVATLNWDYQDTTDRAGWTPFIGTTGTKWWTPPTSGEPYLPSDQWPESLLLSSGSVIPWTAGGADDQKSVRHVSPVFAENVDVSNTATAGRNWLAWAGTADVQDGDKVVQENRIFYTDATGDLFDAALPYYSINHDPTTAKRHPSPVVHQASADDPAKRMWMFWQGGESGKWSIFYSINDEAGFPSTVADGSEDVDAWAPDMRLRVPDSLSSVSAPNAMLRRFFAESNTADPKQFIDIVYAGMGKISQNSDILLGRYAAAGPDDTSSTGVSIRGMQPCRKAQSLARVYGEKLQRDPKYGFFTAQHLAWIRPDSAPAATDNWHSPDTDLPFIHIVFPNGYTTDDGLALDPGTVISATDGSITGVDGAVIVAARAITPAIDSATGVFTYKYDDPSQANTKRVLGDVLVDYSAGIIRFTKALKEVMDTTTGNTESPDVYADYTPQTYRLTTDAAAESSPRAFIERAGAGLSATTGPPPVDRLWVLWRKTNNNSSTIFYKTYRIGVDLAARTKRLNERTITTSDDDPVYPISMRSDGTPADSVIITGLRGSFEVASSGKKIFFSQADERYKSLDMDRSGSADYTGAYPGEVDITYTYTDPISETNATTSISVDDLTWIEECPEQSLLGYASVGNINEGSIYAFSDPDPKLMQSNGTWGAITSSKIWVFWTSTRGGTSDLYWEVLSPNFSR